MKFRKCKTNHNPPYSYGDCLRACVASILDRDDVPHIFDQGRESEEAWSIMELYLETLGYVMYVVPAKNFKLYDQSEKLIYLKTGLQNNNPHVVVCKGVEMIHNPTEGYDKDLDKVENIILICKI